MSRTGHFQMSDGKATECRLCWWIVAGGRNVGSRFHDGDGALCLVFSARGEPF
jgi:hypothetical protein